SFSPPPPPASSSSSSSFVFADAAFPDVHHHTGPSLILNLPSPSAKYYTCAASDTHSAVHCNSSFSYNNNTNSSNNAMIPASAASTLTAGHPFYQQLHSDATPLEDRLDATVAALGDFAFDTPQQHFNPQLQHHPHHQYQQHDHLSSPIVSSGMSSSCPSSSAGDLMAGRFAEFHSRGTPGNLGGETKAFDTLEFFTAHELGFQTATHPSSALGGGGSGSGGPAGSRSSSSPSVLSEQLLMENGFNFNESTASAVACTASGASGPIPVSDPSQGGFPLWNKPLSFAAKCQSETKVIPSVLKTSSSPSSSCSSPSSTTTSSPTSPSYEDIVTPIVACGNCKKSHIKCDHGRPCLNCSKHPNKVNNCRDAVPKPRGRPKGGSKAAAEAMIGGRLQQQHQGLQLYAGSPYHYMRGQPEQPIPMPQAQPHPHQAHQLPPPH
ncbi:hypothetical protein BGZ98_005480, partial [Dissophora globulifera]